LRTGRRRLGEVLLERRLITPQQLAHALEVQAKNGSREFLGNLLVSLGYVPAREMGGMLQQISGVPYVDLARETIDPTAARLLPEEMVRERLVLPLRADETQVWLAMVDPLDLDTIDAVRLQTGRSVVPLLALPGELMPVINRSYDAREQAEQALREIAPAASDEEEASAQDLADQAANAPIVRLVNSIIDGAFTSYASDVHLEPQEDGLRVRYRVDGVLYEQMNIPRANQAAVTSRIKIMGRMDIAERRRPQDGRLTRTHGDRTYDLRASVMPTVHGEKTVLRVLDKATMSVSLERHRLLAGRTRSMAAPDHAALRHGARDRADRKRQVHHAVRLAQQDQ
jgi:type IV pilus assembly protein PilB